jgi:hypothetical protein
MLSLNKNIQIPFVIVILSNFSLAKFIYRPSLKHNYFLLKI